MNLFHVMVLSGCVCVYGCLCGEVATRVRMLEEITRWMIWLLSQFIMLAIHLPFPTLMEVKSLVANLKSEQMKLFVLVGVSVCNGLENYRTNKETI